MSAGLPHVPQMHRLQQIVALCIAVSAISIASATGQEGDAGFYSRAYFGDAISGISRSESGSFGRGAELFSKAWTPAVRRDRNATSCVTCHSVPAAGGAGMSESALVLTKVVQGKTHLIYKLANRPIQAGESRRTPALFGLGLIESSDELVEKGKVRSFLGALGERASIEAAVERAFVSEIGLTTPTTCESSTVSRATCRPDISGGELKDVATYLRFLAAPPRRYGSSSNETGARIFDQAGCTSCHRPTFGTRKSAFPSLQGSGFGAYTDFRMHDLGAGYRVRTTPLWGLNSYGPPYWHTAEASSIKEAIGLHKAEAEGAARTFKGLPADEQEALISFLKNL